MAEDGVVAVFGDKSIWASNSPWKSEVKAVIREFLGERRQAGSGNYQRPERGYIEELQDSPFSQVTRTPAPVRRSAAWRV